MGGKQEQMTSWFTIIYISVAVPDNPMCQSLQQLGQNITKVDPDRTCWTVAMAEDVCEEVHCISNTGTSEIQYIFQKCDDPVGVRVIFSISRDVVWFDHTFTQSESLVRYYGSSKVVINATVDQQPDAVEFGVSKILGTLSTLWGLMITTCILY